MGKKKRSKRSRIRGKRSCGMGVRNNYRGKGMQGGKGMAGTGKRAGQKKTWILKNAPKYFGKRGFKSKKPTKLNIINLDEINEKNDLLKKEGKMKIDEQKIEVELKGYKVLSRGKCQNNIIIKASAFSDKAKEKIEKSGSQWIVIQ